MIPVMVKRNGYILCTHGNEWGDLLSALGRGGGVSGFGRVRLLPPRTETNIRPYLINYHNVGTSSGNVWKWGRAMTPEERDAIQTALISAIKELGEIAECIVKGDPEDHWQEELCDLCGLAIQPMLDLTEIEYDDACDIGWARKHRKIGAGDEPEG